MILEFGLLFMNQIAMIDPAVLSIELKALQKIAWGRTVRLHRCRSIADGCSHQCALRATCDFDLRAEDRRSGDGMRNGTMGVRIWALIVVMRSYELIAIRDHGSHVVKCM